MAPPLVCVTWAEHGADSGIEHVSTAEARVRGWLEDPNVVLIGHNIAYDLSVISARWPHLKPLIFAALDAKRITCTMLRQQLLDIAAGIFRGRVDFRGKKWPLKYDLEFNAKRMANIVLSKDAWRLSYSEFLAVPLEQWPAKAREIQEKAKLRIVELEAAYATSKDTERKKKIQKEITGLKEMVAGDADRCTAYAIDDAKATLAVFLAQEKHATRWLKAQWAQTEAAFALYLNTCWGLCVDAEGVEILKSAIQAECNELEEELVSEGLVREDGTRNLKAAKARMIEVCREEGIPIVWTAAHFKDKPGGSCEKTIGNACTEHICLDTDTCERSGDEILLWYAERTTLKKQLTTDIPLLEKGTIWPVHTRYGIAATTRSTSSKPNIQNQSKRKVELPDGTEVGFREAFVPRPGCVFYQNDYPTLELFTLAQSCVTFLGQSQLAEVLKAGRDPHMQVAAAILQKDYDWCIANKKDPEVKKARQLAKPANFGFPGGMGFKKFVYSTRKAVVAIEGREAWDAMQLDEDRARRLKDEWYAAYPEMRLYFARVAELLESGGGFATVEIPLTGITRGQATYCAASNTPFQGLGAVIAKRACYLVARAQHVEEDSPLYGTRSVAFVHDEIIGECPANDAAHDVAYALVDKMLEAANQYLPDVPMRREAMVPILMTRWAKEAEPRFNHNNRLIPFAA